MLSSNNLNAIHCGTNRKDIAGPKRKQVCLSFNHFFDLSRAELDIMALSIDRTIRNGCSPSKKDLLSYFV